MKSTLALALVGSSAVVYAHPAAAAATVDPRFLTMTPPGPDDVRSPCPGLNTLANHKFLPHNGKGMTIPILLEGLSKGLGMGDDFTTAIGEVGIATSPHPELGSFDLNDLDQHDFSIEHDASLSRQDAYFGNDYSFYQPNFDMVLSYYQGMSHTNISQASKAKYSRVMDSLKRNPQVIYGPREFILSYGETALYLSTMADGDSLSGSAPLTYVKSLFENETLPYNLGWRPSSVPITFATLGELVFRLNSQQPQAAQEFMVVGENTYKDALEILAGGGEILANTTKV